MFFNTFLLAQKFPNLLSHPSTKFMGIHWRPQIFIDPGPPRSRLGAQVCWMVIPVEQPPLELVTILMNHLLKEVILHPQKKNPLDIVWRIQFFHQDFPLFLFSGLFPAIWVYHYHVWCIYNGGIGKCTSLHQRSPSSLGSMALTRERFTPCGHNS